MSYVVLARRYRPQTLEQVIGQEHISRTLENAIEENRVAHAYLFSGPRGVGKTTTARILAKALNCKNGPTPAPCGECVNCEEIAAGSSVDVQEIDGASNRGIDEIRALRENVKFAPASSKYKIYIIDEAHQITDAAFNALLKTLEEPPDHVVFILATTEPQKIPVTILSRCQRYRFRLLSAKEVYSTLERIIQKEGFEIEPAALQIIVSSAGGSLRDALSLLDQAISFVSGKVTHKDIQNLLGFLPKEIICSFTEALSRADSAEILSIIKEVTEQGYNLLQFCRDLREHLRSLLLFKLNPAILEITDDDKRVLANQKDFFTPEWLIRAGRLISRALDEMRWNDQPRLLLELYSLKMVQPYAPLNELVDRLEKLEKNIPSAPVISRPQAYTPPAPAKTYQQKEAPIEFSAPVKNEPVADAAPAPAAPAPEDPAPAPSGDVTALWGQVIGELQRARPIVGGVLADVRSGGISGNMLTLYVANKFQQEGVKRHQAAIEELVEKNFGRALGVNVILDSQKAAAAPASEVIVVKEEIEHTPPPQAVYQVEGTFDDLKNSVPPGLEKILDKFPGKITKKNPKKEN